MKVVTFVNRPGTYAFAKQESIVFESIRALGTASVEEIAAECVDRGLKTKQDPERIVSYYLVNLKKLGLASVSGGKNSRKVTVVVEDEAAAE